MPPRKKAKPSKPKTHLENLKSHYGLARQMARSQLHNFAPERARAIKGVMESAKKHLKAVNAERAKHYQKPLTLEQLIELMQESEKD